MVKTLTRWNCLDLSNKASVSSFYYVSRGNKGRYLILYNTLHAISALKKCLCGKVQKVLLKDSLTITVFLILFKVNLYSLSIYIDIVVAQLFMRHAVHACSLLITITNHALTLHTSFTSTIYAWTNTAFNNFEADRLILFTTDLYLNSSMTV